MRFLRRQATACDTIGYDYLQRPAAGTDKRHHRLFPEVYLPAQPFQHLNTTFHMERQQHQSRISPFLADGRQYPGQFLLHNRPAYHAARHRVLAQPPRSIYSFLVFTRTRPVRHILQRHPLLPPLLAEHIFHQYLCHRYRVLVH